MAKQPHYSGRLNDFRVDTARRLQLLYKKRFPGRVESVDIMEAEALKEHGWRKLPLWPLGRHHLYRTVQLVLAPSGFSLSERVMQYPEINRPKYVLIMDSMPLNYLYVQGDLVKITGEPRSPFTAAT